jgi:hypothetical protein
MNQFEDRDKELADVLGEALEVSGDDAFVEMVMNRADESGLFNTGRWWDVLDMWARPGMAVAALAGIILLATIASSNQPETTLVSIAENLSDEITATELAESGAPNPDAMMAAAFTID